MFLPAITFALASCFVPAIQDPLVETPREAYVEGWYQETAEADLEAALRSYRRCVDLGGAGDRELVARALWRMGMIARARDEAEVAEELLGRVVEEYGDTQAAPRARGALDNPLAPRGAESETVQKAREDLRNLLLADLSNTNLTPKHFQGVFRILSAEQIAAECSRQGESLTVLRNWGTLVDPEHQEKLVDLAFLSDERTARWALRSLPKYGSDPLPERVVALAHGESTKYDDVLMELFAPRREDDAMAALAIIAKRSPALLAHGEVDTNVVSALRYNTHPTAGVVFDIFLESFPQTRQGLDALGTWMVEMPGGAKPFPILGHETPVGERLRAVFPTLPPARREEIAQQVANSKWPDVLRAALDLLLEDPEVAVRINGLLRLAHSSDPEERAELLERMGRETRYTQSTLLDAALQVTSPIWPLESLLNHTEGVLREHAYALAMGGRVHKAHAEQGQGRLDVLRLGLDRQDPELFSAVFAPSDAYRHLTGIRETDWQRNRIQTELLREATTAHDTSLAVRLVFAAQASPDERVRREVPDMAKVLLPPERRAEYLELALRDPSPDVRARALGLGLEGVSAETVSALLLDPDGGIFERILSGRPGSAPLLDALESLSVERRRKVMSTARWLDYVDVLRALYALHPTADSSGIAEGTFEVLKTRDAGILISAVTHPSPAVRSKATEQLHLLVLSDPLETIMVGYRAGAFVSESDRVLLAQLLAAQDEVAQALQRWNIAQLERQIDNPTAQRALATELAALGARERLVELALDRGSHHRNVGGRGLVLLGDREGMRKALLDTTDPSRLVSHAVQLGLVEDCIDLTRAGRIQTRVLIQALTDGDHREELARFVLGEPAPVLDTWSDERTAAVVDTAARLRDPVMLSRAAELLDSPAAVNALFELEAYERILEDLPRWKKTAQAAALRELTRRTGETAEWPEYASEQRERVARWREQLGLPARDER